MLYNPVQLATEGGRAQAAILSRNKVTYLAGSIQKAQLRVHSVKPKNIAWFLVEPPKHQGDPLKRNWRGAWRQGKGEECPTLGP